MKSKVFIIAAIVSLGALLATCQGNNDEKKGLIGLLALLALSSDDASNVAEYDVTMTLLDGSGTPIANTAVTVGSTSDAVGDPVALTNGFSSVTVTDASGTLTLTFVPSGAINFSGSFGGSSFSGTITIPGGVTSNLSNLQVTNFSATVSGACSSGSSSSSSSSSSGSGC